MMLGRVHPHQLGGLSLQRQPPPPQPPPATGPPPAGATAAASGNASTSTTAAFLRTSNGGVQSTSAELVDSIALDSDILEDTDNYGTKHPPRSESSLTSGMYLPTYFFYDHPDFGFKYLLQSRLRRRFLTLRDWANLFGIGKFEKKSP